MHTPRNTSSLDLAYGFATSIGLGRQSNQDAWLASPDQGVFVVADGVGGGAQGDVASQTVIAAVAEVLRSDTEEIDVQRTLNDIVSGLHTAHDRLRTAPPVGQAASKVCASTVVALVVDANGSGRVGTVSAGDSRIYRLRQGRLDCLTRDDARWRWRGWQGFQRLPFRKYLTQAIGSAQWQEPAQQQATARAGDTYLLCTDGLWGVLGDKGLRAILAEEHHDMQQMADKFVEQALALGGRDNITCCVVRIRANNDEVADAQEIPVAKLVCSGTQEIPTAHIENGKTDAHVQDNRLSAEGKSGSMLVELIILFGFSATIGAYLMAEMRGGGIGLLTNLRNFCGRIMVAIGLPIL